MKMTLSIVATLTNLILNQIVTNRKKLQLNKRKPKPEYKETVAISLLNKKQ